MDIFDEMERKWPSAIIARAEIGKFTGGALSSKFLANCDSLGIGPAGRFFIGRRVCYSVTDFTKWLRKRTKKG